MQFTPTFFMAKPVAGHADLAAAGLEQHRLIEVSQRHKGKAVAYISHLIAVSGLVWEDGGTEYQAMAVLLHEAIEDAGQSPWSPLHADLDLVIKIGN
jgi:(p)ppGpp synthase/HD superfamily hydrolase